METTTAEHECNDPCFCDLLAEVPDWGGSIFVLCGDDLARTLYMNGEVPKSVFVLTAGVEIGRTTASQVAHANLSYCTVVWDGDDPEGQFLREASASTPGSFTATVMWQRRTTDVIEIPRKPTVSSNRFAQLRRNMAK